VNTKHRSAASKDVKANPGTRIVALANQVGTRLFHTSNHEAYASIFVKDHWENWRIRDTYFRRWLSSLYFSKEKTTPSDANISAALNVFEGQALHVGQQRDVCVRVAGHRSSIYIDLVNDVWEAVEITREGWRVVQGAPVKFRRSPGMLALPTPAHGGRLDELRAYMNVSEDQFILILGWLVAALSPSGPYPVLILEGNQGTAKSTTSRLLRSFVDPNGAPVRSIPRNERDLMIAAENCWCQVFDNVSAVTPWLSDCLCRLSTGGGFTVRRNYTDDEEKIIHAKRPLILNGISVGVERADLLDRSIVISLGEITPERRKPEKEFCEKVGKVRPQIFGALLDAVACAMRRSSTISIPDPPRMADFANWVAAAESALPCEPGAFLRAYKRNCQDSNGLALEGSLLVPYLKAIAERAPWSGTATDLMDHLRGLDGVHTGQPSWPKTPGALAGDLRRLTPSLASIGVTVQMEQTSGSNSRKIITISKNGVSTPGQD
jgi:hypothetical protein